MYVHCVFTVFYIKYHNVKNKILVRKSLVNRYVDFKSNFEGLSLGNHAWLAKFDKLFWWTIIVSIHMITYMYHQEFIMVSHTSLGWQSWSSSSYWGRGVCTGVQVVSESRGLVVRVWPISTGLYRTVWRGEPSILHTLSACICVYVCMHVCTRIHIHSVHASVFWCILYTYVYVYVCTCVYLSSVYMNIINYINVFFC